MTTWHELFDGSDADLLETKMTFDEFWHAQPFGWAACDAMTLARKVWDHQQAEIDELMLEFCPGQMTADQIAEYERHQITVTPNTEVGDWAADEISRLQELVRWAYSKLHPRTFNNIDDALKLDEMKLLLEHGA